MKKLFGFIFFVALSCILVSCTSSKKYIVNSFGGTIDGETVEANDFSLELLGTPTRDDGAMFEDWYMSLNFDDQFKVTSETKEVESGLLFAKYDKCYCFSLRYGTLGCYGQQDPNYSATFIDYFIPAGKYDVTFTDYSTAKIGSVMIMSNSGYTKKDGYPYKRQNDFKKTGEKQTIIITEDEHVFVTSNSVFLFQRSDVDSKYSTYSSEISFGNTFHKVFWPVFGVAFAFFLILFAIVVLKIKKGSRK